MIDQLIIGEKASFDDFKASLAQRKIKMPKKKSIKETVPFSNVTYDYSAINGEVYWEERELEYIFEITADSPEELEEAKRLFADWIMNIQAQEIHDPFIPDYHFKGTYESLEAEDDEGLDKTTVTVIFLAYPYMIANIPKVYQLTIPASGKTSLALLNESSHPVAPTIYSDVGITLNVGTASYTISAGTVTNETVKLPTGLTSITLTNNKNTACTVKISLWEEVF